MKSVLLPSIQPQLSQEIGFASSCSLISEYSPPESSSSGNYSGETQELQRDITTRKCLIDAKSLDELKHQCQKLKIGLGAHATAVDDLHPKFQQIWEEQLDRVRRQQEMYKNHIASAMCLRQNLQHLITAISQLSPYVKSITQVIQHVFPQRLQCEELGPMQRICNQICTLEPNSQHRVDAIEKQEQSRKEEMERKKLQSGEVLAKAKKHLKSPKDGHLPKRKALIDESADSMIGSRGDLFRCVDRERINSEELISRRSKSAKPPHARDVRKPEGVSDYNTSMISSGSPEEADSLDSSFEYFMAIAERPCCAELPTVAGRDYDQEGDKRNGSSSRETAENANCHFSFQSVPADRSVSSCVNYFERGQCCFLGLCVNRLCSSVERNNFMNEALLSSLSEDLKCATGMSPEQLVEEMLFCQNAQEDQNHGSKSNFSMISPALVASVMPSTWEAREKVLASLKKKIAQLEISEKSS
ncbi:unnamed protein product [Soboliphyme baturini]|uniref:AIP3 domain-containing protein n=1 Tax=Soboliphyme baturini TaxID=241478 RepID=A0A183ITF0_9BILA|nr:unnamed protein product [Soboliphyme baturini]